MIDADRMTPDECPLVSLVIPVYNHAGFVSEAIKSVLEQDYPHIELIVIDDGSTDATASVLRGLGMGFHWETQANMGQSRTLEKGWARAKGEILGYLSADDRLEPHAVSAAVAALRRYPEVVATYSDFHLIDPQSRTIRRVEVPDFAYEDMLGLVSCPVGPGAFFRREAYEKTGPWNAALRQMPDFDFWLRLGLHGKFLRIPQTLASFRVHDESQTYSITTPQRAAEPVEIVSRFIASEPARGLDVGLKRRALASAHLVSAQLHLRAGRVRCAIRNLREAYAQSPKAVASGRNLRLLLNAAFNRMAHKLLWNFRSMFGAAKP